MNKKLKTLLSVLLTVCMLVSMTNSTVAALYETAGPQFGEPVIAGPITDPVIDDPIDHPIIDDPVPNDPITDDPIGDPEPDDGIDYGFMLLDNAPGVEIGSPRLNDSEFMQYMGFKIIDRTVSPEKVIYDNGKVNGALVDGHQYVLRFDFVAPQYYHFLRYSLYYYPHL